MKTVLPLVLLGVVSAATLPGCHHSPGLWCSSWDIAVACKVEKQCVEFYSRSESSSEELVQIELYYECLCGGCRSFFTSQLFPTWMMLNSIMNITLVPYGNAQERNESGKWVFECQHGPNECLGNMIETCLMNILGSADQYLPIIYCIESAENVIKSVQPCLEVYQPELSLDKIMQCANGDLGNKLMHENAQRTQRLDPPHKFVPWIVVNGKHTDELQSKALSALFNLICETYTGPKPIACQAKKGPIPLEADRVCMN
ncbi:hypothetical protein NDU88_005621 [Pleurodeles waltl]|uniref:Gamma-interferon-inducible lysosomal thiol reductase n=1 Tax=Pleurodeles waltl TaxID=8319 RepID=A0AAV7L5D5_PLEWA|nr:hypothetical protein NDU88_005621 [Pleurodeles waltl]